MVMFAYHSMSIRDKYIPFCYVMTSVRSHKAPIHTMLAGIRSKYHLILRISLIQEPTALSLMSIYTRLVECFNKTIYNNITF